VLLVIGLPTGGDEVVTAVLGVVRGGETAGDVSAVLVGAVTAGVARAGVGRVVVRCGSTVGVATGVSAGLGGFDAVESGRMRR
jgi:hypothetical protein